MYEVDPEECTGCGICVEYCPTGAIRVKDRTAEIEQGLCTSCGTCGDACPQNAIFEYHDVPVVLESSRMVAPAVTPGSAVAVRRRGPVLARREKVAAAAVILPALSRLLVRLAGRVTLRGGSRGSSNNDFVQRQSVGGTGRGGHRWHGGRG